VSGQLKLVALTCGILRNADDKESYVGSVQKGEILLALSEPWHPKWSNDVSHHATYIRVLSRHGVVDIVTGYLEP